MNEKNKHDDDKRFRDSDKSDDGNRKWDAPDELEFKFIHHSETVSKLKPMKWLIDDILLENSFFYDFGESGHYKTFVAIDRALCIAAGFPYHGHSVKQGTVFYICGEGQQQIGRRIAAWYIEHKKMAKDVPLFIGKTPTQLMDPGAVDNVRRAVDLMSQKYGQPAMICIDTLARNFGEGDESSTRDMNRVISNIDRAFGNSFCVGLVHHPGHKEKHRARGSYALHGAADSAFRIIFTQGQQIIIECIKQKDARPALPMLFDRKIIKLRIRDVYEESYILKLVDENRNISALANCKTQKISKNMDRALNILKDMCSNGAQNIIISDWKKACAEKKVYSRKSVFDRAFDSMLHRNLIFTDETKSFVYPIEMFDKINCDEL